MLRAAMTIIGRQGAAGATLAEVGLAAGYSRGLPIERFGSKLGLIKALLDSMDKWFQARLDQALLGKTGVTALKARIETHVEGARRSPVAMSALYSLYIESLVAMPELRPSVSALTLRWLNGFVLHLREGQKLGEVRRDLDCDQYGLIILGALRGLMIEYLMKEQRSNLSAVERALSALVDDIIRSSPAKAWPNSATAE